MHHSTTSIRLSEYTPRRRERASARRSFSSAAARRWADSPACRRRCRRRWRRCRSTGPSTSRGGTSRARRNRGVHRADEVAFLGQHFARGAEVDHHGAVVVGDEDVGRLDVQVQHLVLVHDAQAAQDLVEQRADGGFAEHLLLLQLARGDDEVLQGGALQVVHHHVDGLVLAEEIQHAHHGGVRDLGERAAFLEEALQAQAVERELLGRTCGSSSPGPRVARDEGRYSLMATCWPSLSTARYTTPKPPADSFRTTR
jgi:hypothetical protein